jgi:AAA+ ATPase superfamily predicted ATPase
MNNPFKFGSVVSDAYFTDRHEEYQKLRQIIASENHVIMMAPRRFGKTSLVNKVVNSIDRPVIWLDLQLLTGVADFASQLLKQLFKKYPFEKLKFLISNFRFVPALQIDPVTNNVEISFQTKVESFVQLEDVLNLIEKLGEDRTKPIVVLDEFQELLGLDKSLDKKLRSVIQFHKNVNYVLMGSVESLMRQIFENKKSPFYHFGQIFSLNKIDLTDFRDFLDSRFISITEKHTGISEEILKFSKCHPYYTQQLAFHVWMKIEREGTTDNVVKNSISDIILMHDNDFDRIWSNFNNTDKKILIGIAFSDSKLLTDEFKSKNNLNASSTVFSGLKRLLEKGVLLKTEVYEFDDPFFREWIIKKRNEN